MDPSSPFRFLFCSLLSLSSFSFVLTIFSRQCCVDLGYILNSVRHSHKIIVLFYVWQKNGTLINKNKPGFIVNMLIFKSLIYINMLITTLLSFINILVNLSRILLIIHWIEICNYKSNMFHYIEFVGNCSKKLIT